MRINAHLVLNELNIPPRHQQRGKSTRPKCVSYLKRKKQACMPNVASRKQNFFLCKNISMYSNFGSVYAFDPHPNFCSFYILGYLWHSSDVTVLKRRWLLDAANTKNWVCSRNLFDPPKQVIIIGRKGNLWPDVAQSFRIMCQSFLLSFLFLLFLWNLCRRE